MRESNDLQHFILENLLKTPHIQVQNILKLQKTIIIPALLNDLYSNNTDKIHTSLSALNRMYNFVSETEDGLKILSRFFENVYVEKQFLAR